MASYVSTLMDVERRFGALHDHDYPIYRAVWASNAAKGNGLGLRARNSASNLAADDFKRDRVAESRAALNSGAIGA